MKVARKLSLTTAVVLLLAFVGMFFLVSYNLTRTLTTAFNLQLAGQTQALADVVTAAAEQAQSSTLRSSAQALVDLAGAVQREGRTEGWTSSETLEHYASYVVQTQPGGSGIAYLLDESGTIYAHPDTGIVGVDISATDYVQAVLDSPGGLVTYGVSVTKRVLHSRELPQWDLILCVVSPYDTHRELVQPEDVEPYVLNATVGETGYAYLINFEGDLLAHPTMAGENIIDAADAEGNEFIREMIENRDGSTVYPWPDPETGRLRERVVHYRRIPNFDWIMAVGMDRSEQLAPVRQVEAVLGVVQAGALVLLIVLIRFATRVVVRPIGLMVDASERLANSDLRIDVHARSRDEFGRLADHFNRAVGSIRNLILEVQQTSLENEQAGGSVASRLDDTLSAAIRISESAETAATEVTRLVDHVQTASTAVEQIDASVVSLGQRMEDQSSAVSQTTAAMEQMSAAIASVARIAEEKTAASRELVAVTEQGDEQVSTAVATMESLGRAVSSMLELTAVIDAVAEQTSLLAMNAAIEAAHAGEAGQGFAVVAEEIRKLSTSTTESSQEISATLKTFAERIGEAVDATNSTGTLFDRITDVVQTVTAAFEEIRASTDELHAGTGQTIAAAQSLMTITSEVQSSVAEMTVGSSEVRDMLLQVRESSDSVRGLVDSSRSAGADVNLSAYTMALSTDASFSGLLRLLEQLGSFTVTAESADLQRRAAERIRLSRMALSHSALVGKARGLLDGTVAEESAAGECDLGVWLAGPAREEIGDDDIVRELERTHTAAHEAYDRAVGSPAASESTDGDFEALVESSKKLVRLLSTVGTTLGRRSEVDETPVEQSEEERSDATGVALRQSDDGTQQPA